MFTVVVTGSRTWTDKSRIHDAFAKIKDKHSDVRLVNGTARGADRLCATLAVGYGFRVVDVPADWERYGRSAGYRRNVRMLEMEPDLVLAFWDGTSKGTKHTIDEARRRGLKVCVCTPQGWER